MKWSDLTFYFVRQPYGVTCAAHAIKLSIDILVQQLCYVSSIHQYSIYIRQCDTSNFNKGKILNLDRRLVRNLWTF